MKRKRSKPNSSMTRFLNRFIGFGLLMLALVGAFGVGVVWTRHQISEAARKTRIIERSIALEERKLSELGAELSRAMSPASLLRKNEQFALGMQRPLNDQIIRVTADVDSRLSDKSADGLLSANFTFAD